MPRASRRRRRPRRRGLGQSVLVAIAATITVVLVAGSLIAIHTQSKGYRCYPAGYVALADRVGQTSTATGARLSTLMGQAAFMPTSAFPLTARGVLEQGLDAAVLATSVQARQALNLASPPPQGGLAVTVHQGHGVAGLGDGRPASDRRPPTRHATPAHRRCAVIGHPGNPDHPDLGRPGGHRDGRRGPGLRTVRRRVPVAAVGRLRPASPPPVLGVGTAPVATAPLSSESLGATATYLASSPALVASHQLVVTAVGLAPPAVPTGGVGTTSTSCAAPVSLVPGPTPALVPPTSTVDGTGVGDQLRKRARGRGEGVGHRRAADPAGTAPPPAGSRGGRTQAVVSLASGSSSAPALAPLPVAAGHVYTVTVAVSTPARSGRPGRLDPGIHGPHRYLRRASTPARLVTASR